MLCQYLVLMVNEPHSATVLLQTVYPLATLYCIGPLRWRLRADGGLDARVGRLAVRSALACKIQYWYYT
jgi:hypothetical protein